MDEDGTIFKREVRKFRITLPPRPINNRRLKMSNVLKIIVYNNNTRLPTEDEFRYYFSIIGIGAIKEIVNDDNKYKITFDYSYDDINYNLLKEKLEKTGYADLFPPAYLSMDTHVFRVFIGKDTSRDVVEEKKNEVSESLARMEQMNTQLQQNYESLKTDFLELVKEHNQQKVLMCNIYKKYDEARQENTKLFNELATRTEILKKMINDNQSVNRISGITHAPPGLSQLPIGQSSSNNFSMFSGLYSTPL
jgi:hypothetical protein